MKEILKYIELNEDKEPINRSITHSSCEKLVNAGLMLKDEVVVVDFDNDNKNENKILEYLEKEYPIKVDVGLKYNF